MSTSPFRWLHPLISLAFRLQNCASASSAPAGCFHRDLQAKSGFGRWTRDDFQFCAFADYEVTYAHYVKFPS